MDPIADVRAVDTESYPYVIEKNVTLKTKAGGFIRCNIYRPKAEDGGAKYPVLATIGPYGKDVHYHRFNPGSYAEVEPAHKTDHSCWETPTPSYWTEKGYVVVRADEPGAGQSPGFLDTWSKNTIDAFVDLIEWTTEQTWSNGKVGLLGISYYGVTQWHVAARKPKGLAAIVPWEAQSDLYRDACRHGGILANGGLDYIWDKQIGPTQYGLPGKSQRCWGDDTIEGSLPEEELARNRLRIVDAARANPFRDGARFASVNFNLEDIEVPLLSVANWGGFLLHLRGNVQGFIHSASELKYLRFIVGRHDLPFYYPAEVEVQRSFLDAFLKDDDREGWTIKGKLPPVDLILRQGNVGYNDPKAESKFLRRKENEWPIARTQYKKMFLGSDQGLHWDEQKINAITKISYHAFGVSESQELVSFSSAPFQRQTEITGHIVARLNVSATPVGHGSVPSEIDLFLSLRHIDTSGKEIFYTGTTGEAAPITKGFLRVSLRKTNPQHPRHKPWLPYRDYISTDVLPVIPNDVYEVDIEVWPTNVVMEKGEQLVLDIGSRDLAGCGKFSHDDPIDRSEKVLKGINSIHFGPGYENYLIIPVIPEI